MTMQAKLANWAAKEHETAMAALPQRPAMVQPPTDVSWYAAVEWSSSSYDRDRVSSGVGALIGPRHVLTCAQRVVAEMDERFVSEGSLPLADKNFSVRVGGALGRDYEVRHIVAHPKFTPVFATRRRRRIVDLAVLVLSEEVAGTPIPIGDRKALRSAPTLNAFGNGPSAEGPYSPVQVNTAIIPTIAGATAGPSKSEFVLANVAGSDGMGPGFLGAPVTPQLAEADGVSLVALVSRGAHGLPTENQWGAPCVAVDVTRHARWIAATVASRKLP